MRLPLTDLHTHIYPYVPLPRKALEARRVMRGAAGYLSMLYHKISIELRNIPEWQRALVEEVGGCTVLPMLLLESNFDDHKSARLKAGITRSVVVAHPPFISNDFVTHICQRDQKLLAAIQIPTNEKVNQPLWQDYINSHEIKLIKLHPLADRRAPSSKRYNDILEIAKNCNCSVIVHSGALHSKLMFGPPEYGSVSGLESWFSSFPEVSFIVAHMNFHEPELAWEMAKKYDNVFLTSSWQPERIIKKTVQVVGPEKLLFSSDWPLLGNNMKIGADRLKNAIEDLPMNQQKLIMFENASQILGLPLESI